MVIASLNLCCLMQRKKQELLLYCSPVLGQKSSRPEAHQAQEVTTAGRRQHWPRRCRGSPLPRPGGREDSARPPAACRAVGRRRWVCGSHSRESCGWRPRSRNHHGNLPRNPAGKSRKREPWLTCHHLTFHLPFLLPPHASLKRGALGSVNHNGKRSLRQKAAFSCQIRDGQWEPDEGFGSVTQIKGDAARLPSRLQAFTILRECVCEVSNISGNRDVITCGICTVN